MCYVDLVYFLSSLIFLKVHGKGHPAIEDYGRRGAYMNWEEEPSNRKMNLVFCKILDPKILGSFVYDANLNCLDLKLFQYLN